MGSAFVALGSNQGERRHLLDVAAQAISELPDTYLEQCSSYWETAPEGGPSGQLPYLNAVLRITTPWTPQELLGQLQKIENRLGRTRQVRWGPRTLDLDLLAYDDVLLVTDSLTLPHPRMHLRSFVLGPMAEIAPTWRHPVLDKSVAQMLVGLPNRDLTGKRGVVTGSSSGIGRAIALALAARGASVLIHAARSEQRAEAVRLAIATLGVESQVVLADLQQSENCHMLADKAWTSFGPLDFWINNAGADTLTGSQAKLSFEEKWNLLFAVDVRATALLGREIGSRMQRQRRGVILNVGWNQAETGMEGDSGQLFGASKGAVMAYTRALAVSLAPEVRVNCIAPGWIRTAWGESASEVWQERARREAPLGRWGVPQDIAELACWLVSDASSFVTGQIIRSDGGAVRG